MRQKNGTITFHSHLLLSLFDKASFFDSGFLCFSASNTIFFSQSAGRVTTVAHSPPTYSLCIFCRLISRPVRRLVSKSTQNASLHSFRCQLPPFRLARPRSRQTNPTRPLRRCIPQHQPSRTVRHRLALQTA